MQTVTVQRANNLLKDWSKSVMSEGSSGTIESQKQLRDKWSRLMKQTVDADEWGQTLEAMEGYER